MASNVSFNKYEKGNDILVKSLIKKRHPEQLQKKSHLKKPELEQVGGRCDGSGLLRGGPPLVVQQLGK